MHVSLGVYGKARVAPNAWGRLNELPESDDDIVHGRVLEARHMLCSGLCALPQVDDNGQWTRVTLLSHAAVYSLGLYGCALGCSCMTPSVSLWSVRASVLCLV